MLDLKDRKILNQLDINCRQSDSEIGKKVRLSKEVVNYRIKRLLENKIITGFYPHINIAKINLSAHKIYLRFKSLTKEKEQELWNYLISKNEIVWVISCSGRWDIIFGIVSKTIEEFNLILTDFMNQYSQYIAEKSISVFSKATLHHRKWLLQNQQDIHWLLGGKIENEKIDEIDKKIMDLLSQDARMPIIKLAKEVRISSSLIIQRIKKLQQKKIIEAFRASLNKKILDINYCKSFIYLQTQTSEKLNQLLAYCYSLNSIIGISESIGPWDLELEFEVPNYNEFHDIMKELKNKFPIISNFETVYIEKEYGNSFLPEL